MWCRVRLISEEETGEEECQGSWGSGNVAVADERGDRLRLFITLAL